MAPTSRYRSAADLPKVIPLFPLRGVILLPRGELPLNVFEPRYLAMVEDALAGDRVIGIIQPERTLDAVESPAGRQVALKRVGGAGRITGFQELNDGRLGVSLTGISRFTISLEQTTDKPYRLAHVDYAAFEADLAPDGSVDKVDREALLRVLKLYLDNRRLEADWGAISRAPLEPLVNGLSAMSPFGPEEKQALLEAIDLERRTQVLVTLAEMVIASGPGTPGTTLQ